MVSWSVLKSCAQHRLLERALQAGAVATSSHSCLKLALGLLWGDLEPRTQLVGVAAKLHVRRTSDPSSFSSLVRTRVLDDDEGRRRAETSESQLLIREMIEFIGWHAQSGQTVITREMPNSVAACSVLIALFRCSALHCVRGQALGLLGRLLRDVSGGISDDASFSAQPPLARLCLLIWIGELCAVSGGDFLTVLLASRATGLHALLAQIEREIRCAGRIHQSIVDRIVVLFARLSRADGVLHPEIRRSIKLLCEGSDVSDTLVSPDTVAKYFCFPLDIVDDDEEAEHLEDQRCDWPGPSLRQLQALRDEVLHNYGGVDPYVGASETFLEGCEGDPLFSGCHQLRLRWQQRDAMSEEAGSNEKWDASGGGDLETTIRVRTRVECDSFVKRFVVPGRCDFQQKCAHARRLLAAREHHHLCFASWSPESQDPDYCLKL